MTFKDEQSYGKKDNDKAHVFKTFMWLGSELFHFILWQVNKLLSDKKKIMFPSKWFQQKKRVPCENTKIFPDQQGWNIKGSNAFTEHLFLFWISLKFAWIYPPNMFERAQGFNRPWGLS